MADLRLDVLDRTVQETNRWLNQIAENLTDDKQEAYHALRAVLFAVRDRTPTALTAKLGAQLPLVVRGILYEGYDPSREPLTYRSQDEWNEQISKYYSAPNDVNPEETTRAVFRVLNEEMDPGVLNKVKEALPEPVRQQWPETAGVH